MESSMFSFEEHLLQASIRPKVGASRQGRQFAAIPDGSPAPPNPAPQAFAASPAILESSAVPSNSAMAQSAQPIQDLTATAAPQSVQWTSPNGLTTTGVMNPFGLTKNNPSMGFYGAEPITPR